MSATDAGALHSRCSSFPGVGGRTSLRLPRMGGWIRQRRDVGASHPAKTVAGCRWKRAHFSGSLVVAFACAKVGEGMARVSRQQRKAFDHWFIFIHNHA